MQVRLISSKSSFLLNVVVYDNIVKELRALDCLKFSSSDALPAFVPYEDLAASYQKSVQVVTSVVSNDMITGNRNYLICLHTSMFLTTLCNALMNVEGLSVDLVDGEANVIQPSPSFMPAGDYFFGDVFAVAKRRDLMELPDGISVLENETVALYTLDAGVWKDYKHGGIGSDSFPVLEAECEYGQTFYSRSGRIGIIAHSNVPPEGRTVINQILAAGNAPELGFVMITHDFAFKSGYMSKGDVRMVRLDDNHLIAKVKTLNTEIMDKYSEEDDELSYRRLRTFLSAICG